MKGEFNTGLRFAGFVRERGTGKVVDRALVDGRHFHLEGVTLAMTVHDDGSVDLRPQEGDDLTREQRKGILDLIEDRGTDIRGDMHHYVGGITFSDPDGGHKMLLRVTVKSPYAKLMDIFGEEEQEGEVAIPDRLAGLLEDIMSEPEGAREDTPAQVADTLTGPPLPDPTASAFERMMREKADELSRALARADEVVAKRRHEVDAATALLKAAEDEARVIADRVRSMGDRAPHTGLMVHVSEMTNEKVSLDEDTERKIRGVVSKVKSIKLDNFMKLFNSGEYRIGVFRDIDGATVRVTDPLEIGEAATSALHMIGAAYSGKDFVYRGDLGWHEIVDHFVCRGFGHLTRLPDVDEQEKNEPK